MREKYESLSAAVLKDLAKARGMKHLSGLKKADLVERMLEQDAIDEKEAFIKKMEAEKAAEADKASESNKSSEPEKGEREKKASDGENAVQRRPRGRRPRTEVKGEQAPAPFVYRNDEPQSEKTHSDRTQTERVQTERKSEADEGSLNQENTENTENTEEKKEFNSSNVGGKADGILEVLSEGYGFIRCDNYMPGEGDVYVSPSQIRKFNLKTGDIITGFTRVKSQQEKFSALLYVNAVNGFPLADAQKRPNFEDLTPVFPNRRIRLEVPGASTAMRIVDLVSPIGCGQRGMIVSQPKAGKTTLLKQVAKSVTRNEPDMHLIILLIDERPEEVTDMKEAIKGPNVEVIYSTFDETPEHHKRVSEMVIERAKRLVEHGRDVMILLDSITRLARAYNLTVPPSGRTLSGGLDPAALHMPKRFFGAARNMREGGSLTILATALVDTGSKMDDVVFEEFKGTGNMELVLDRKLSEKRVFPAIDIVKSSTRREDLLLDAEEQAVMDQMRRAFNGMKTDEAVEQVLTMFSRTRTNREFIEHMKMRRLS